MATSVSEQRRHLAAWRSSGLSRAKYCKKIGIPASRMEYWDRRERKGRKTEPSVDEESGFIQVSARDMAIAKQASTDQAQSISQIEPLVLRFPSGHELLLPATVTPMAVAELTSLVCRC